MSFHDLRPDWPTTPLTDTIHIADMLDLLVDMPARIAGSLLILICDHERRPFQPVLIEEVAALPNAEYARSLRLIATTIAGAVPGASALCAVARDGGLSVTSRDQAWREAIEENLGDLISVLGVHLVTPDGSRLIHTMSAAS